MTSKKAEKPWCTAHTAAPPARLDRAVETILIRLRLSFRPSRPRSIERIVSTALEAHGTEFGHPISNGISRSNMIKIVENSDVLSSPSIGHGAPAMIPSPKSISDQQREFGWFHLGDNIGGYSVEDTSRNVPLRPFPGFSADRRTPRLDPRSACVTHRGLPIKPSAKSMRRRGHLWIHTRRTKLYPGRFPTKNALLIIGDATVFAPSAIQWCHW